MAAAWVAWCRAALALAFTLAAAPFRRRRPLPGAGEVIGGGAVAEGDTISSLILVLPSLVVVLTLWWSELNSPVLRYCGIAVTTARTGQL